jgi:hypothetical protein
MRQVKTPIFQVLVLLEIDLFFQFHAYLEIYAFFRINQNGKVSISFNYCFVLDNTFEWSLYLKIVFGSPVAFIIPRFVRLLEPWDLPQFFCQHFVA